MKHCKFCKHYNDCIKRIGFTNSYGMIHHEDLTYCSAFDSYDHNPEFTNLKPLYNMVIKGYGKFIDMIVRVIDENGLEYVYFILKNLNYSDDILKIVNKYRNEKGLDILVNFVDNILVSKEQVDIYKLTIIEKIIIVKD